MIVITGAAGFIGSCIVGTLNSKGINNLILVDDFSKTEKAAISTENCLLLWFSVTILISG
ncbi:NAD-dependent epimerase/dehydratase family protein [Fluviicola sp.]|uniref:NAD-dependent epimerase/dehydratase family protein n=1 Tax=Fluviicola sp. TaxID=1917219 RepID=UPI003D292C45